MTQEAIGRQLRSMVKKEGILELSLARVPTPEPNPYEVVVRIDATPINPSDLGLMLAGADMSAAKVSGSLEDPVVTAPIPPAALRSVAGRIDQSLPVGNEGAGVVVRAGSSDEARALVGKTVAILGGAMYAQFRTIKASQCLVLPPGTAAAEGASCFVNPLTALGMVETDARGGPSRTGAHCRGVEPRSDAGQDLRQRRDPARERRPSAGARGSPQGTRREARADFGYADVHGRADRSARRHRRHARIRRDRRRQARESGALLHGSGRQSNGGRIQPLRFDEAQAGVHLRRS